MIDWLLVDYGEVLSRALPEATFTELAAIADLRRDEFRERYWRYRPDYDRGQTPLRYWSAVLDRDLTRQRRRVERLTAVDVNGWTRLNSATLRTTLNTARRTRTRLALLSNAPNHWPTTSNTAIGSATSTTVSTAAGCGDSNPSRAHSPTR